MEMETFVTQESCSRTSRQILDKLEQIERRLFKDNGTISIQTRLDRHERVLRGLLWVASVMAGTILASWTLGLYSLVRHAMLASGGVP